MATQPVMAKILSGIRGLVWKCKTFLFKQWIAFQDRFGWYTYANWICENEPNPAMLIDQERQSLDFNQKPLISCLLALKNVDFPELERTLASLTEQTYDHWEVYCFIPPGEIDANLRRMIDTDLRFRLLNWTFQEDFFISGDAFNAKTLLYLLNQEEIIKGEFLCVLESGDTVAPSLFYRAVEKLNQNANIDLFYTDEDHITTDKRIRHSPFFKPDWSPELLYSINYLRFSIVRTSQLQRICLMCKADIKLDDLVLRCAYDARLVSHIPEIGIHFLDHPNTDDVGNRYSRHSVYNVNDLLRRGFSNVQTQFTSGGELHFTWQTSQPLVSIIIPTKDHRDDLQCAIETIRAFTHYASYELVIVDNESIEPTTHQYYERLRSSVDIRLVDYPGEFNFSTALNRGVAEARGDVFVFLNNDVEIIDPEWLGELVQWTLLPEIGIVGAKLLYPDGTIQHAGLVLGMQGHANHIFAHFPEGEHGIFGSVEWYRNVSAVTGACMAIRRDVFVDVGGFNTDYQLAFSDIDICLQVIQHGYRVVYNPFARLIHHEGQTRPRRIPSQDIQTGFSRFGELISRGDPYYNPNLSYAVRYPTYRRKNEESREKRLSCIVNNVK